MPCGSTGPGLKNTVLKHEHWLNCEDGEVWGPWRIGGCQVSQHGHCTVGSIPSQMLSTASVRRVSLKTVISKITTTKWVVKSLQSMTREQSSMRGFPLLLHNIKWLPLHVSFHSSILKASWPILFYHINTVEGEEGHFKVLVLGLLTRYCIWSCVCVYPCPALLLAPEPPWTDPSSPRLLGAPPSGTYTL